MNWYMIQKISKFVCFADDVSAKYQEAEYGNRNRDLI